MGPLAQDLLRLLDLLPERRIFGERVQFVKATKGIIPVKDASSGGRARIGSRLPQPRFQRAWPLFRWWSESGRNMLETAGAVNPACRLN
jgi:hypothetical protein